MSRETIGLSETMQAWLVANAVSETPVQKALRDSAADHAHGGMQSAPEQVQFMQVLLKAIDARLVIEIGVFTGYSSLGMALALPPEGRLIACDVDDGYLSEAATWWARGGVQERIDPRFGPAEATLETLLEEGLGGQVDFIYIDADKTASDRYCELGMQLLRPGGLVAIDNMFRGGRVVDATADDASTVATRALASKWSADARVDWCLLPVADGLALARRR
ncbi:MAG: class I SAM-dependent methyltransferase [Phycisphaerales bacterium]|nr:class I SAM-dependent methyltransferase [Phycisphaerales bacterium]